MAIQIIGAGFGRTGTTSLKIAFERLLGGTSHHMWEVLKHPHEMSVWRAAAEGTMPDWRTLLAGYTSACSYPAAAFWPELAVAFPDAPIVLSVREPESWWKSVSNSILLRLREAWSEPPGEDAWADMMRALFRHRFADRIHDPEAMKDAFVANNERVRREVDPARLVVWQVTDGWGPLCAALKVPVPDEPFPVSNTTKEFREKFGFGALSVEW
jgi:hypothetical protein